MIHLIILTFYKSIPWKDKPRVSENNWCVNQCMHVRIDFYLSIQVEYIYEYTHIHIYIYKILNHVKF